MVIDRVGKIAYRSNGFEPDTFELNLAVAVRRATGSPGRLIACRKSRAVTAQGPNHASMKLCGCSSATS